MGEVLLGNYDWGLVCLSVVIACCASYAALQLAGCTFIYKGLARISWISGGAVAMGIGIWAMHYIGMLAFRLPVRVLYHLPSVGLSLLAAIASAAIALYVVSRSTLSGRRLAIGSLAMGIGIFGMHYIGMAAMRLPADCLYNPWIVALSGLIAVIVSGAALWIAFKLRQEVGTFRQLRLASAVVMGGAISAMHYTGMAAASFQHSSMMPLSGDDVSISGIAVQAIVAITLIILMLTLVAVVAAQYVSRQAELLRNTQAEYRLFVEHNLACVCRTALDGRVLEANLMALNVFGYRRLRDMIGADITTHYEFPEERQKMLSALERQGVLNGIEVCLRRRDGSPVWILLNVSLTKNLETGNAEIISTAMDISAMKRTQEDLKSAKDAAEDANRAKDQFLAKMSHELRTPLNGILGMTTLALDSNLPTEVRSYIEDANMSANQLLKIINDVLDYSKIDAQKLKFEDETFSLRQLLHDCIRTLAAPAELKRIYLRCKLATPLPQEVRGDRGRLLQILLNLVGNAVKFTDRGGVVMSVESTPAAKGRVGLHFKVSDSGVGIPAEKLVSIFDAFVQADNSDARRFGGSGLGLAISAQLATGMGGKIWAESVLGNGSTFHLLLNLALPASNEDGNAAFSGVGDSVSPNASLN